MERVPRFLGFVAGHRFFHVAVLDHLIGVPHKFIDPLTKIVRARLTWLDSDPVKAPFSVNIDYVRWGIRP